MKHSALVVSLALGFAATFLVGGCVPKGGTPAFAVSAGAVTETPAASHRAAPASPTLKPATATPAAKRAQPTASAETPQAKKKAQGAGASPAAPNGNVAFLAPEILGRPTDHSVTVNVAPAVEMDVYIEYGDAPGVYGGSTEVERHAAGAPFELTIDGLPANARVYYRLRYRTAGATEFSAGTAHSFWTQRAAGSAFTFDIQGDSHPERVGKQFAPELYQRALANVAADQPDFFVLMGDDFSVDTLKTVNPDTVTALYVNQRQYLGAVGGSAPLFLVNGNHEQAALANLDGTADNVAVWAQTARNAWYPQPAPDGFYTGNPTPVDFIGLLRNYYAFTWGDALFVIIDPYWHSPQTVDNQFGVDRQEKAKRDLWNVTLGEAQYQWFKRTLENSNARYKFVFAHHVNGTGRGGIELADSYEWGDAAGFATRRPGWGQPIHQLMAQNGVTIFFQGHDHLFARQELNGVVYQTLPEPANPFYTVENEDAFTSGNILPNSGHLRVSVSPEQVIVEYVRAFLPADERAGQINGDVAFSYTVAADGVGRIPDPSTTPTPRSAQTPRRTPSPKSSVTATPASTPPVSTGFPGNIVLGRPTDRSMTVSLLSDINLEVYLEYGPAASVVVSRTAPIQLLAGQPAHVDVSGLSPDTAYVYRAAFRRTGEPAFTRDVERGFRTQRPAGDAFTFTIDADPHNRDPNFNAEVYGVTLRGIVADRPDFHINLGDTFMAEKLAPKNYGEVVPTYREMRSSFGLLGGGVPLFLVNGNHDGEWGSRSGGGADNLAAWAVRARQTFYPNPAANGFYAGRAARDGYYAWTWGDALFVALDPYWYSARSPRSAADNWDLTLGDEQYEWLRTTLEESRSTFKFVFIHNLVGGLDQNMRGGIEVAGYYEWGGQNADGSWGLTARRPGWSMPIHQLLAANHVSAVFHGHDHLFVKQELDGIVYQEIPQPSYASYDKTGSAAEYGYSHGDILGCCGYLRVSVGPADAHVEYVRSYLPADENAQRRSGQVSYSYLIKR